MTRLNAAMLAAFDAHLKEHHIYYDAILLGEEVFNELYATMAYKWFQDPPPKPHPGHQSTYNLEGRCYFVGFHFDHKPVIEAMPRPNNQRDLCALFNGKIIHTAFFEEYLRSTSPLMQSNVFRLIINIMPI